MKLNEIAARLDCVLMGDGDVQITGVAGIEEAGAGHLTFVSNPKYASKAKTTKASAVIVSTDFPELPAPTLRSSNPYLNHSNNHWVLRQSVLFPGQGAPERNASNDDEVKKEAERFLTLKLNLTTLDDANSEAARAKEQFR